MLNPSLHSRFVEEFSRFSNILAGSIGEKIILHYKIKNVAKNKKSLKNAFLYKNNKKCKKRFYIYDMEEIPFHKQGKRQL